MTPSPKIRASTNYSNSSMSNSTQPPTQQSAISSAPQSSASSSTSTWIKAQAAAVYPYAVLKKGRRNLPQLKSSSSSSSSSAKTEQASDGVSKTERFPTSLSMTRTGGPLGFGFSPLTPITPPSSTSSPSLKSPRTSLHSNVNVSSGNVSLSDSSHIRRHGLVQSNPSTDTHFVGLGLKISEKIILHLHDDQELFTEQMAETLTGSIVREREREAVASGMVGNEFLDHQESSLPEVERGRIERNSNDSPVISNDTENDEIIPPPTPVPLVLELASSPPPPLRSTLLTELTGPDEKDWPEFTPLPDPVLSLESSSEKPNPSGANQYLYQQHPSHLKHNDLNWQHNNPFPLQQQQNLQQQENVPSHHHHHLHHQHHHPHHSYKPHHTQSSKELGYLRGGIGEKELLTPKASVSPSSKGNIKGISNHSTTSKNWKPSSTTTGEAEQKGSSYTPGGGPKASVSGGGMEYERVQLAAEDEIRKQANEYQQKQQKDQQQPLTATKQPIQPLQPQIEQVRRGRSQRPRLLWRSTLPQETLNILDQHHLKRYGEKIPRLPVRSPTGVAAATGTRDVAVVNSTAQSEEASDPTLSSAANDGIAFTKHQKDTPSSNSHDFVQSTFAPLPHEAAEGHQVTPMSRSSPIKPFVENSVVHNMSLVDGASSQTSAGQETCSGETVERPNLLSSEGPISAETSTKFAPIPSPITATAASASVAIPSSKKKTRRNTIRLASLSRQGRKWSRELDKSGL